MSDKKVPIQEATEPQLRAFAESHLGITIAANARPETVLAKVKEAWPKDHIVVIGADDEGAKPEGAAPPPVTADQQPDDKGMVTIMVQRTEEAGGDDPVFVAVNGRGMLIPRGEWHPIPVAFYEVLRNAVKDIYDALPDGGMNPIPRKVPSYPFQTRGDMH
ncbi:MAG: hypothetical protein RJQ08_13675 [Salinisphaeraceae bacterium]